ncbi:glycine betaine/L-proline ABC transporter ATP-binding protein, partial [Paraburkholderia sp. SIMBA_049]
SVMTSLVTVLSGPSGVLKSDASGRPGPGFLLDADERILGTVTADEIEQARGSGLMPRPDTRFICVRADTRLVDVAGRCNTGQAIGVIDDAGRLIGRLEAGQILARIGAHGAAGARHV